MKKNLIRVISLLLVVVLFTSFDVSIGTVQAASMPGFNAKITEKNIMTILNKYDKESAYVVKKMSKKEDVLQWFKGSKKIVDNMDVAIHELTHGYLYEYAKYTSADDIKYAYYVGGKKTIYVPRTKVFNTKKIASSIPKKLRTFRYNTYVSQPTKNLSSNVDGAYGLLNEFMAYRMGMKNTLSLYPYYVSKNAGWNEWYGFIVNCENDRLAYAEFKYYILHYLYYAKKHNKTVYNQIVNNKQFCKAYRKMESSYAKLIKKYETDLKKIKKLFKKKGITLQVTSDKVTYYYSKSRAVITSRFTPEYKKLQNEMKKSKYKSIHKKLVANGK